MSMRLRTITTALSLFLLGGCLAGAQGIPLDGIAHVAFRVSDLQRMREFYRKLGFEQAFEFADSGKTTQAFIKISDRQFVELYPKTKDFELSGLMHVCYEASNIASVRDTYEKAGLSPTDVKKARAGNLLFVLHDPDGQLVEYTQYMPGSLHSEDRGKHLDAHRVAEHLAAASLPVKDVSTESAFYIDKLEFMKTAARAKVRVPGTAADEVELISAGQEKSSQITFTVKNLKQTAKFLRKQNLQVDVGPDSVLVEDPDGNRIVFSLRP